MNIFERHFSVYKTQKIKAVYNMTWLSTLVLTTLFCAQTSAFAENVGSGETSASAAAEESTQKKLTRVAVYPIFAQIVALTFPDGFVSGDEIAKGRSYLQESIPKGETVDKWSQMISVSGMQGAALQPNTTSDSVAAYFSRRYRALCPQTLSSVDLGTEGIETSDARVIILGCGTVESIQGAHSEAMLLIVLKGREDFYTIQWASRGPAASTPINLNRVEWTQRLHQLEPIKVCDRVAGQPSLSCVSAK